MLPQFILNSLAVDVHMDRCTQDDMTHTTESRKLSFIVPFEDFKIS